MNGSFQLKNRAGLPRIICDAMANQVFDPRAYPENILWVTQIVDAPLPSVLKRRHFSEIADKMDVMDLADRTLGSAWHQFLYWSVMKQERGTGVKTNYLLEERAYLDLETMEVITLEEGKSLKDTDKYSEDKLYLSCKLDCYDPNDESVDDHKLASVWSYILSDTGVKPETIAQINIYAYVLRKIGFPTKTGRVIYRFRDWSASAAAKQSGYPKEKMLVIYNISIWPDEKCEAYIRERAVIHTRALAQEDENNIPACTPDERWEKPTTYAVMKSGRKTAVRVLESMPQAEKYIVQNSIANGFVDVREGKCVRCEGYCEASPFCHWWKKNGQK